MMSKTRARQQDEREKKHTTRRAGLLSLLLRRGLTTHLTGTSERSVNFTCTTQRSTIINTIAIIIIITKSDIASGEEHDGIVPSCSSTSIIHSSTQMMISSLLLQSPSASFTSFLLFFISKFSFWQMNLPMFDVWLDVRGLFFRLWVVEGSAQAAAVGCSSIHPFLPTHHHQSFHSIHSINPTSHPVHPTLTKMKEKKKKQKNQRKMKMGREWWDVGRWKKWLRRNGSRAETMAQNSNRVLYNQEFKCLFLPGRV